MLKSVLDQGYVRLIRIDGSDADIIAAARQSYDKDAHDETRTEDQDRRLLNYLMRNDHTSPFEMAGIVVQVKCPIFVARQWIRHRTASVNEMSGRYTQLPDEYYLPTPDRIQGQSKDNKQGSDGTALKDAGVILDGLSYAQVEAQSVYEDTLQKGVSKELARICLPVSIYTTFTWRLDLHNLLHFLRLRLHPHAQWEIREYAKVLLEICQEAFPLSTEAALEHRINGARLSATVLQGLSELISPKALASRLHDLGLAESEIQETIKVLYHDQ